MISNKKSYAMKMLQLALALSLLQVNPDDYLEQRLRNWDSQLELRDGDGWELEMLRAVPMVEYPYANRKTMMPLIEDLIRFDSQSDPPVRPYNVTAYLLNVSTESANQTAAALQEMQPTIGSVSNGGGATSVSSSQSIGASATASVTTVTSSSSSPLNASTVSSIVQAPGSSNATHPHPNLPSPEIELFLNQDSLDHRSVWEQNLADLNDFNDLPIMNSLYANLPLKDGQQDMNGHFDLQQLDIFLPTFASSASESSEGAGALNDTVPHPDDVAGIKLEQLDEDDDKALQVGMVDTRAVCSTLTSDSIDIAAACIKQEKQEDADADENIKQEVGENSSVVDLSPFINSAEMSKEGKFDSKDIGNDNDDNQLEDNEWAGIPFTIDNETGEYIRLPLDEILNDVIQFAELAGEENEVVEQTEEASTSKAAAASKSNKKNLKSSSVKEKEYDSNKKKESSGEGDSKEDELESSIAVGVSKRKSKNINKSRKNTDNTDKSDDLANDTEGNDADKEDEEDTDTDTTDAEDENEAEVDNDDDDEDDLSQSEIEVSSLPSPLFDLDDEAKEELADLSMMLHSSAPFVPHPHHHHHHHPPPHHPHVHRGGGAIGGGAAAGGVAGTQNYGGVNSAFHRQPSSGGFHHGHHQGRMPLSRGVSMEQRLQDIASLFNPIPSMGVVGGVSEMSPYPHYPTHPYTYQGAPQHAQYPPPPPHPHAHHHHAAAAAMLHPNASLGDLCSTQPHYGHNLGSAVTSSMHLTNSTHDSDVTGVGGAAGAVGGAYKMEHDMMYYSNASSDMNHTTDGFINSILNDEDLHLMDMNVNDSFCRMVDVNNSTSNNSSVLGISASGHTNGPTGGGSSTGSTSGLSMSGASNVAAAAAAAASAVPGGGMTSDLMNGATSGAQGGGGADRLDASSDSAVSSMGSERVPSLSDGEWGEGSDSAQDYHQGKYGGPYDYSYNNGTPSGRFNDGTRQPPVAQKKHHMFGKRYLNEQPNGPSAAAPNSAAGNGAMLHGGPAHAIKYEYDAYPPVAGLHESIGNGIDGGAMGGPTLSKDHHAYGPAGAYSVDFSLRTPRTPHEIVQHNHTYTLPQGTGSLPRPQQRDKKLSTSSTKTAKSAHNSSGSGSEEDSYMTRDEKRARAMNIPISVTDIINLPMDEFNERLSKYDLSENQLSLIRDIRRRGKNKVAAQNCRKRKLDQILSLEDEVKQVRRRKEELQAQRDRLFSERKRVTSKFSALHRHIFHYLRDPEGNPCSPSEYSLQQAADGSVYLLPRDATTNNDPSNGILNGSSQLGTQHHSHMGLSQATNGAGGHQQQAQQHHHLHNLQTPQQVIHATGANHAAHHQQQQQHHSHHHHHQQQQAASAAASSLVGHGHQTLGGSSGATGGSHQSSQQKD